MFLELTMQLLFICLDPCKCWRLALYTSYKICMQNLV